MECELTQRELQGAHAIQWKFLEGDSQSLPARYEPAVLQVILNRMENRTLKGKNGKAV